MFKTKRKINSKIRFQNSSFQIRLQRARGYKRRRKSLSDRHTGFLNKAIWQLKTAVLIGAVTTAIIIYMAYIPNFLFVKKINVVGSPSETSRAHIEASVKIFLQKKIPWPQGNLVLLQKNRLKQHLTKYNSQILSVNKIEKGLPDELYIEVSPRLDKFLLQTEDQNYYVLSNDGLVSREVAASSASSVEEFLQKIRVHKSQGLGLGQAVFEPNKMIFLGNLAKLLPDAVSLEAESFEVQNLQSADLIVNIKGDLKIIFSINSDLNKGLIRLKALLGDFYKSEVKKIRYIDMRFENRGYVCLKGALCASEPIFANSPSTSPANSGNPDR